MLGPQLISYIRTLVPMIVGYLLSIPLVAQILNLLNVPEADRNTWLARGVSFALAFAYYVAVRALERKWPKLGVLLGVPAQPTYQGVMNDVTAGHDPLVPIEGDGPTVIDATSPQN